MIYIIIILLGYSAIMTIAYKSQAKTIGELNEIQEEYRSDYNLLNEECQDLYDQISAKGYQVFTTPRYQIKKIK